MCTTDKMQTATNARRISSEWHLPGPLFIGALAFLFLQPAALFAAPQQQKDILTEQQTEDLREYADRPAEKIKLFLGYLEDRAAAIHRVDADPHVRDKSAVLHNLYSEFTELSDELQDNMDSYEQEHADMRKSLKLIVEKSEAWPSALNEPKADPAYDFVRKTALDAGQSVHDDAKQTLEDETKYFALKKKDKDKGGGD